MRKLSLFSGIGGIDLAAHWAGMETIAFCEREPFPQKVLQKNFPDVPIYDDVCMLTKERLEQDGIIGADRAIDIISAGYPCQPFSHAGQRRGTEDDRHLWPEVARLLREIRPRWFVGENVAGHITLGLDDVLDDLEGIGYTAQAFVIPASAVYASHRRDRVIIVGYASSEGLPKWRRSKQSKGEAEVGTGMVTELERSSEIMADSKSNSQRGLSIREETQNSRFACSSKDVADTDSIRLLEREFEKQSTEVGEQSQFGPTISGENVAHTSSARQQEQHTTNIAIEQGFSTWGADANGTLWAAQSRICGVTHELPEGLDGRGIAALDALAEFIHSYPQPALMGQPQYDWEPPRVATGVKNRAARLKALGNAVDPLQIYPILAAIKFIDDQL